MEQMGINLLMSLFFNIIMDAISAILHISGDVRRIVQYLEVPILTHSHQPLPGKSDGNFLEDKMTIIRMV